MSKLQNAYETFILRLKQEIHDTETVQSQRLDELIEQTQAYLEAAGELTQDEWALIAQYVREDLQQFEQAPGGYADSAFYQSLKESIWGWLLDLSDRSQLQWVEMLADIRHKGHYQVGDRVGLGIVVCERCGYRRVVLHPEKLSSCIQCEGTHFRREPLTP